MKNTYAAPTLVVKGDVATMTNSTGQPPIREGATKFVSAGAVGFLL